MASVTAVQFGDAARISSDGFSPRWGRWIRSRCPSTDSPCRPPGGRCAAKVRTLVAERQLQRIQSASAPCSFTRTAPKLAEVTRTKAPPIRVPGPSVNGVPVSIHRAGHVKVMSSPAIVRNILRKASLKPVASLSRVVGGELRVAPLNRTSRGGGVVAAHRLGIHLADAVDRRAMQDDRGAAGAPRATSMIPRLLVNVTVCRRRRWCCISLPTYCYKRTIKHWQFAGLADLAERKTVRPFCHVTNAPICRCRFREERGGVDRRGIQDLGLCSRGTGADNIRNVTGTPTAGIDPQELLDAADVPGVALPHP